MHKGGVGWLGKPRGLVPTLIFYSLGKRHQSLWPFVPSSVKCQVVQEWFLVGFASDVPFLSLSMASIRKWMMMLSQDRLPQRTLTNYGVSVCVCFFWWGWGIRGGSVLFSDGYPNWPWHNSLPWKMAKLKLWEAQLPKHCYPRCRRDHMGHRNGLFFSIGGAFALPSRRFWLCW